MLLETLLTLAGPDTTVILLSDHGFHSGELRPADEPGIHEGAPLWHRPYGILAMSGPGILRDERVYGTTLLDITPTILTLFGLPVGKDMDGKVILSAFEQVPKVETVDSWESIEGESGMHSPSARADPFEAQEALRQLAELGYINLPQGEVGAQIDVVVSESKYNLACSLLGSGQHAQAVPILRELIAEKLDDDRFGLALAAAMVQADQFAEARQILERLRPRMADHESWNLCYARVLLAEGHVADALARLNHAATLAASAGIQTEIGRILESSGQLAEAQRAYERALDIDSDFAIAHCGLGVIAVLQDGTQVPVSVVYRKGLKRDGSAPTLIDAYGSYGINSNPYFAPRYIAWLEHGGVWATAHVRGGGEFGREWHEAGRLLTKPNTWGDLIAAGEKLVADKWTSASKLAIRGGSAGGITV